MTNRGTKDMSFALSKMGNTGGTYVVGKSLYYKDFLPYGPRALEGSNGRILEELESYRKTHPRMLQPRRQTKDGRTQKAGKAKAQNSETTKKPSIYEQIHGVPKAKRPRPSKVEKKPLRPVNKKTAAAPSCVQLPKPAVHRVAAASKKTSLFASLMSEVESQCEWPPPFRQ